MEQIPLISKTALDPVHGQKEKSKYSGAGAGSGPIGIYDSGVGGLTVLREVQKILPAEDIIYFGDTAHVPYGSRPASEILDFNRRILTFFAKHHVKLAIAACGTSSSLALATVSREFSFPILGMILPGARAAVKATRTLNIGVIATEGTIASGAFENAIKRLEPRIRISSQACPMFVPLVEGDFGNTDEVKKIAQSYLDPLEKDGIDTLILGCTHYPHLSEVIQKVLGKTVQLIDPALAVAEEAKTLLKERDRRGPDGHAGHVQYFVSGSVGRFQELGSKLLGKSVGPVFQEIA